MRNLQTAWEAIEKGDRVEAQSLVAQILRDDPRNAEAWMVLGEAVSGERQVLFLRKALQLNPDLTLARERLEELEAAGVTETGSEEANDDLASKQPDVPEDVSLDAPTVAIADRVNADRAAPQAAKARANIEKPKKSGWGNTLLLIVVAIAILAVIFQLIQTLPG
ncbi:MAG: hypothetical protein AB8G95_23390 [Anaerolineae bacterium]